MDLVEMQGISKFFPGVVALNKVNFDLRKSELHALIGENGAGKSTLVKILAGVYKKDKGKIIIEGKGTHFDPDIVDAFSNISEGFRQVAIKLVEYDEEREALAK